MFLRAVALAVALIACHHDSAPAPTTPAAASGAADKPPLPPASGTPIGFLIDDAAELKLSDDQLGKLRDIDTGLASELEVIDGKLRVSSHPAEQGSGDAPPQMGRHGRRGMGGMGGGGRSGHHRSAAGAGSGSAVATADQNRLTEQRADDVRDAIHRAMIVLDATQQQRAAKVLEAHDVDVDAGRPTPGSEAGSGDDQGGADEP